MTIPPFLRTFQEITDSPMCLPTEFKFCTCDAAQLAALPAGEIVWRLHRATGVQRNIVGKIVMPAQALNKGKLTSEWLEQQLNGAESRFDFAYQPQDNDEFVVSLVGVPGQYLSFVCRDGRWVRDQRLPFGSEKVSLYLGTLKA